MSKLNDNKTLNRYQNPEIFEQLAIEYAVGSLHGRARKRFEVLMDTHFYLKAVVDAYEHKFAHLVELLPETQPSKQVWDNIEAHISSPSSQKSSDLSKQQEKTSWWKSAFFKQGFGLAVMALVIAAALFLNPMTITPTVYSAVLETPTHEAIAITKIQKSDMKLSIELMKEVDVADDMELTLWCHPKDRGGKPMKMGTVSKQGKTMITISKDEWKNLKNVGMLTVHVEPKNSHADEPSDEIILQGKLNIIAKL